MNVAAFPHRMDPESRRVSRRHFLAATAAITWTACRTPVSGRSSALVGTQLYGWTQYYQRAERDFAAHLDEVLNACRDCGYDYVEGFLNADNPAANADFAERLLKHQLRPVSLYTGGRFHDPAVARQTVDRLLAAATASREAGFSILNCDPDPVGREKTDDELRHQVAALVELGQGLKSLGLRLGIHHHMPSMQNRAREFHYNFQQSPAGVVDFCYDVDWVYRGGVTPADALDHYGDRVVSWHLRQSRQQIWWEDLAPGDIDYRAIARVARERRLAPRYTVELAIEPGTQITRSARDNHARSRAFVREVFGV
jgi:sugar phosphate isomerase/epimerase